jgi:PBP1b-binding outer membrane lipoprotein LpoB
MLPNVFRKLAYPHGRMKSLVRSTCVTITLAILLLSGCQKATVATNPDAQRNDDPDQKTKPLQAADLVGYNGTALRKSVHKIIQGNEKHNNELENGTSDQ